MLIPRGKYTMEVYDGFFKFHGRTHDYKILFKDVNRAFLLQKPDSTHVFYIIALNSPIRQGQTQHHYLAMQIPKELKKHVKINLSPDVIAQKHKDELMPEIDGYLYDIISRILKSMIKINIIVPSGFKSANSKEALKCSVKANEGYLYPLRKSLLFLHKPIAYIKHNDITQCQFERVSEFAAHTSRSFDCSIILKNGDGITFSGLEKQEYQLFYQYLSSKKFKVDIKGVNQEIDMDGDEDKGGDKQSDADQYYDEDDDEDFVVDNDNEDGDSDEEDRASLVDED